VGCARPQLPEVSDQLRQRLVVRQEQVDDLLGEDVGPEAVRIAQQSRQVELGRQAQQLVHLGGRERRRVDVLPARDVDDEPAVHRHLRAVEGQHLHHAANATRDAASGDRHAHIRRPQRLDGSRGAQGDGAVALEERAIEVTHQ
jgi:hypothetical protein